MQSHASVPSSVPHHIILSFFPITDIHIVTYLLMMASPAISAWIFHTLHHLELMELYIHFEEWPIGVQGSREVTTGHFEHFESVLCVPVNPSNRTIMDISKLPSKCYFLISSSLKKPSKVNQNEGTGRMLEKRFASALPSGLWVFLTAICLYESWSLSLFYCIEAELEYLSSCSCAKTLLQLSIPL